MIINNPNFIRALNGSLMSQNMTHTTVSNLSAMDPAEDETENVYLLGCLLDIKYHPGGQGTIDFRQTKNSFNARKAARGTCCYRRMFTFADLNTRGKIFCIFELNNNDTTQYFRSQPREQLTIGDIVVIQEPDPITQMIHGSVHKVNTGRPWILVPRPGVNEVPAQKPELEKQTYFYLKASRIQATKFIPKQAICNGTLCDRQNEIHGDCCGCYTHDSRVPGFVLAPNLKIDLEAPMGLQAIPSFRSWRFTKIFFKSIPPTSCSLQQLEDKLDIIRTTARQVIQHVNDNGGWDIVGWYKQGIKSDSSARGPAASTQVDQTVASDSQKIHVVYLYPTNTQIFTDQQFKDMLFDPDELES